MNTVIIDNQAAKGSIWINEENGNILLSYEILQNEKSFIRIRYYDGLQQIRNC